MPVSAAKAPSRSAGPSAAVKTKTVTYKVQQGDTMWAIARKFNVHPKELMRQNRLEMDTVLRPGDSITVTQE
jgi:membrane-bound lytic murein transglycosylase D